MRLLDVYPSGRRGKATEVVDVVLWLGSERAGFVSRSNFVVSRALCNSVQF